MGSKMKKWKFKILGVIFSWVLWISKFKKRYNLGTSLALILYERLLFLHSSKKEINYKCAHQHIFCRQLTKYAINTFLRKSMVRLSDFSQDFRAWYWIWSCKFQSSILATCISHSRRFHLFDAVSHLLYSWTTGRQTTFIASSAWLSSSPYQKALYLLGNKRRRRKAALVNPVLSESHRNLNDPCLRNKPQNVGVIFIGMCFAFSCKD